MQKELFKYVQKCILEYPNKKDEIIDIYYLTLSEIEEGNSEAHECELAYINIEEIIISD